MDSAKLIVLGAAGRMGQLIINLVREHPGAELVGAVEVAGSPTLGRDAGELAGGPSLGVSVTDDYASLADSGAVALDFTLADAALEHLRTAVRKQAAIVIGTTGFSAEQREEAERIAPSTRAVIAPNMSVGVNVLRKLVTDAARLLGSDFDPEIVELHHKMKVDAPSGTAVALGRDVAGAVGRDLDRNGTFGRHGMTGRRGPDEIGVMALRGGDAVGDHTVYFVGFGERLELTHRATNRECLARGAVRAGIWLARQSQPGLYTMADVLGF